ncbi:MAG: hypothetical protein LUG21_08340 [Clostridiales bacterium]|nr:hypothetical protein [Clostridiales bacterium]
MKKNNVIIFILLLCISIGIATVYFIYGSTLIDITNEKSISNSLASDPDQSITILKTAQNGDYFGVLYTDPVDENDGYCHFRFITKSKFYRNKYRNIGGNAAVINAPDICYDFLNQSDEDDKTVQAFLYTFNSNLFENNKCSVFECNAKWTEIDFEEITDVKQIVEKRQKLTDSLKKIDEFELPNEDIYIIPKNYELSQPNNKISFVNGSVSLEELKQQTIDETDLIINEYYEYLKGKQQ